MHKSQGAFKGGPCFFGVVMYSCRRSWNPFPVLKQDKDHYFFCIQRSPKFDFRAFLVVLYEAESGRTEPQGEEGGVKGHTNQI